MKKLIIIAFLSVFTFNFATAQIFDYDVDDFRDKWQKNITVPASQDAVIDKLFLAWGKAFPNDYVDDFITFKSTGKSKFKIDYAPKNGFVEIAHTHSFTSEFDGDFKKGEVVTREHILQAVYWNLTNGNKLFGVSIYADGEVMSNCAIFFYEYNATKATLTPRADIVKKVMTTLDDNTEIFVKLPKVGRDLKYNDFSSETDKVIKWNGNGF
ncbi:MAG: hypothetical protein IKQ46_10945 [Bacteroidales bacterium]|nr:hypothetical protein [Bacteroidales bacterium]